MGLIKRAAAAVLAVIFAAAILVCGHWTANKYAGRTAHIGHRPRLSSPRQPLPSVALAAHSAAQGQGCNCRPFAFGDGKSQPVELTTDLSTDHSFDDLPRFATTIHAGLDRPADSSSGTNPVNKARIPREATAAAGPCLSLPPQITKAPPALTGPELPFWCESPPGISAPPASGPQASSPGVTAPCPQTAEKLPADRRRARESAAAESSARRIIEKALPESSADEREVWREMLKDLSPNDRRELLRLREQFGRLPSSIPENQPQANDASPLVPDPSLLEHSPLPVLPGHSATLAPAPPAIEDAGPERVIRETLRAVARARQIIVNNIANANTIAYKRELVSFESAFWSERARSTAESGPTRVSGGVPGLGARICPCLHDMSQGKLRKTGRPLDLAIEGDGFFQLLDPKTGQTIYTRNGRFVTDPSGGLALLASNGRMLPLSPAISIPRGANETEIASDGTVRTWQAPNVDVKLAGAIQIVRFIAPTALVPLGENLYWVSETGMLGPDSVWKHAPPFHQGCLEESNVDLPPDIDSAGKNGRGRIRQGCLEESNVDLQQELEELQRLNRQAESLDQAARLLQLGVPGLTGGSPDRLLPVPSARSSAGGLEAR